MIPGLLRSDQTITERIRHMPRSCRGISASRIDHERRLSACAANLPVGPQDYISYIIKKNKSKMTTNMVSYMR